jgi:hypothetical protein
VPKNEIRGFFDKDILVHENERVVLLVDGAVQRVLGPGVYTVGGLIRDVKTGGILSRIKLGHAENVDVLYVNLSDIDLNWGLSEKGTETAYLWTSDGYRLPGVHGQIRLKISEEDAPKLFANMMDTKSNLITQEDLFNRIRLELLGSVIAPVIKSYKIDDLWGNKTVIADCYNGIETEMRKTLSRWGFGLVQFTINYNFPPEWLSWKDEVSKRTQTIDQASARIKMQGELGRAQTVSVNELEILKVQYANQIDTLRKQHELAVDRDDVAQAFDIKRQMGKLKQDLEMSEIQVRQASAQAEAQVRQSELDAEHRREVEKVKVEQEGRAQTLQVLAQTGAPQTIEKMFEAETLQKIAEKNAAGEAAKVLEARYNLDVHQQSEVTAFKQAQDMVTAAKIPPPQPIIVTPTAQPSSPTTKLIQEAPSYKVDPEKTCSNCNAENSAAAKFCISCGKAL